MSAAFFLREGLRGGLKDLRVPKDIKDFKEIIVIVRKI